MYVPCITVPSADEKGDGSRVYTKGETVWYKQRDGTWAPAKVCANVAVVMCVCMYVCIFALQCYITFTY